MADQMQGPTLWGKPVGRVGAFFQGTDPQFNAVPTREPYQQLAQMGTLIPTLGRLAFGFGAPSIAPAAREAQRQFREETVPGLLEQFGGHGSQGSLLRGLQGAGSDLQSKLGALKQQQAFELQKIRQEQLPRLLETSLSPAFQPVLTDKPIAGLPELQSAQIAQNPQFQQFANQAQLAGQGLLGKGAEGIKLGRQAAGGLAGGLGEAGKDISGGLGSLSNYLTPGFQKKFPKFAENLSRYAQAIKEGAQLREEAPASQASLNPTPEAQKNFAQNREITKFADKANISDNLRQYLRPEHLLLHLFVASSVAIVQKLIQVDCLQVLHMQIGP